jgi:hypothetical protein
LNRFFTHHPASFPLATKGASTAVVPIAVSIVVVVPTIVLLIIVLLTIVLVVIVQSQCVVRQAVNRFSLGSQHGGPLLRQTRVGSCRAPAFSGRHTYRAVQQRVGPGYG